MTPDVGARARDAQPSPAFDETAPPPAAAVDARTTVLALPGHGPVPVDTVVRESRLTAAAIDTILLELELAGCVERQPGNRVSLSGTEA